MVQPGIERPQGTEKPVIIAASVEIFDTIGPHRVFSVEFDREKRDIWALLSGMVF